MKTTRKAPKRASKKAMKAKPKTKKSSNLPEILETYDPAKIEPKWRKKWASSKIYSSKEGGRKPKYYVLDMFPYPSGEGLHVGHPKGYIATDVISRMKRMQGYNVLHPMGFDAFGLPAENYALKTKTHPEDAVKKNVKRFKEQLEILGFDYDWSREVNTTDPKYYKWTQWIFLQLFKKGLAYESFEPINWCPSCKTGLANEDIENGRCERCGTVVEKKPLRQWVLKITDYAERLLGDLDATDYEMPKIVDKVNPHQPGLPIVKRYVAHAIVFDPKNKKYLIIRNKKHGWDTVVIGGVEENESPEDAARREVREETGYLDIEFKRILGGPTEASYCAKHKGENRVAIARAAYFELKSDKRVAIADGEDSANEILWIEEKDFVPGKMVNSELPIWLERIKNPNKGYEKKLLDWPQSIVELQKNWIGKSEGALIKFKVKDSTADQKIEVFTTRPDTLFGVSYVVLAPEHKLTAQLLEHVSNKKEVEDYIAKASKETEIERTDAKKEKTGVELKGIKAINPANDEEVPVWISDYVLADYGTGAVMAVPAHDERDWAFAKKFGLPMKEVVLPYLENVTNPIKPGFEIVFREHVSCILRDPKNDKYAYLKWSNGTGWTSFIGGGINKNESVIDAGKREIREESGYKNIKHVATVGECYGGGFAMHKNENRLAHLTCLAFELIDDSRDQVEAGEKEKHEIIWTDKKDIYGALNIETQKYLWDIYLNGRQKAFTDTGYLINSGEFSGRPSEETKKDITKNVGGEWVTKYKLRDWVFSRQRYWGEPIPVVHCVKCGVVPVPEKDLPIKLPKVKSYEPTGTGESPLAGIDKWVNTKCPKCKGKAKRETNTMPQWAGSSWYHLRYEDPKNDRKLVDLKKEKYWSPVDVYVGGAEHATRHLIYARFWHKFLYDIGSVSTIEPFIKLQHVGLIMGEDGRKMSKRFGNVVNPDDVVKMYGADSMRVYEMFMGPFDQQIAWSTSSIVGARRFIERIWKLKEKVAKGVENDDADRLIHKAIKKVSDDILAMRFNTAISALMITVNELDKMPGLSRHQFETLLKLIAPFAPHIAEELWYSLGNKSSIHISAWPIADEKLLIEDEIKMVVQVDGKVRASINISQTANEEDIKSASISEPNVKKWIEGKTIQKIIIIKGKVVSIVTS